VLLLTVGSFQCRDCSGRTFGEIINTVLPNHSEIHNSWAVLEGRKLARFSKFVHLGFQNNSSCTRYVKIVQFSKYSHNASFSLMTIDFRVTYKCSGHPWSSSGRLW